MSHVLRIHFASVSQKEGCTCDRCGQGIRNIWTVDYAEGFSVHYGIDCWEKVYKSSNLSQYGEQQIKKIMKSIKSSEEMLAKWVNGSMDEDAKHNFNPSENDAWYGHTFEEYKEWMINEFIPYQIECKQKELKKFSKVNFNEQEV